MSKPKKPFYKKWWVWVLAIIVIAGLAGGGEEESTSTSSSGGESKATAKKEEKPKTYAIGDTVKVGDITFLAKGVEEVNKLSDGYSNKTTEGKFAVIELTVTNNDKESRYIDGDMFRVLAGGNEYSSDIEYDMYVNDDLGFFLEDVNPGISKTGKIVFELPADVTSYDLQVSSGLGWSGGKYASIKLK